MSFEETRTPWEFLTEVLEKRPEDVFPDLPKKEAGRAVNAWRKKLVKVGSIEVLARRMIKDLKES